MSNTNEILFLELALEIGPNKRRSSELTRYKSELVKNILFLKDIDPENFILKARRYIEYQVVLDFAEPEIQQLPHDWKKDLWRDAALLYGDRVFDLMAEALEKYNQILSFRDNPYPEEFSTAIQDRAKQQLLTFPTMNNSDAEYIVRYLELVGESIENIEALQEYIEIRKNIPADWNIKPWDQRASIFGKETLKYLKDALVLEHIMEGLIEETSSSPSWQSFGIPEKFAGIRNDLKNTASPVDARLAVSRARKAATNFSTASFFIHAGRGIEPETTALFINRALAKGRTTINEFNQRDEIFSLHQRVASLQEDLGIDAEKIDQDDQVYFERLVRYRSFKDEASSVSLASHLGRAFSKAALVGFSMLDVDTRLPEWSTIGCEQELFGIKEIDYAFLDETLGILSPGTLRTKDATIRPTDDTQGMEIVSGILTKDFSHLVATTEILKSLGGKADLPCALHAHHGLSKIFEERQLDIAKQVKLNYMAIEDDLAFIDSALTYYYRDVFSDNGFSEKESIQRILAAPEMSDLYRTTQPTGRRRARVNLQSVFEHGTMEFRQHPDTVEPAEVRSWVKFVSEFVEHAANMISTNGGAKNPEGRELDRLKNLVYKLRTERVIPVQWNLTNLPELNSLQ